MIVQSLAALILLTPTAAVAPTNGVIKRVSVPTTFAGPVADDRADPDPSISADGRWVAFVSYATNLVPNDTNGKGDVFVRDTLLSRTVRASVGPGGAQADADSREPSISGDGRYVTFASTATTLVPGDPRTDYDVFVRDLRTGTTTLVSRTPAGTPGDSSSFAPDISADGRHVAFQSYAGDLLPGPNTGYNSNIFVRDLTTGAIERLPREGFVYVPPAQHPSISADGNRVTYLSQSPDPKPVFSSDAVFLYDRTGRTTTEVSAGLSDDSYFINDNADAVVSGDGRYVLFTFIGWHGVGVDAVSNVYRYDVATRRLRLVSGDARGRPTTAVGGSNGPDPSADARYVTFTSRLRLVAADTDDLLDVYRWDATTGRYLRLTGGQRTQGSGSYGPSVSASGNRVAFFSDSTAGLVPGPSKDSQIYLWSAVS